MAGESLPTVGKILGHAQAQTTPRYAHLADDPLQSASDRVASSLKKALDGEILEGLSPACVDRRLRGVPRSSPGAFPEFGAKETAR